MSQILDTRTDMPDRYLYQTEQLPDHPDETNVDAGDEIEYRSSPSGHVLKVKLKLRMSDWGKPLRYPLAGEE